MLGVPPFKKPRETVTKVYKWVLGIYHRSGLRNEKEPIPSYMIILTLAVFRGAVGPFSAHFGEK